MDTGFSETTSTSTAATQPASKTSNLASTSTSNLASTSTSNLASTASNSASKNQTQPPPSPTKKPAKRTTIKARDVIELPKPYNRIRSDDVKRWDKELKESGTIDEKAEGNLIMKEMSFTNALVLKTNQLAKQVRSLYRLLRTM